MKTQWKCARNTESSFPSSVDAALKALRLFAISHFYQPRTAWPGTAVCNGEPINMNELWWYSDPFNRMTETFVCTFALANARFQHNCVHHFLLCFCRFHCVRFFVLRRGVFPGFDTFNLHPVLHVLKYAGICTGSWGGRQTDCVQLYVQLLNVYGGVVVLWVQRGYSACWWLFCTPSDLIKIWAPCGLDQCLFVSDLIIVWAGKWGFLYVIEVIMWGFRIAVINDAKTLQW